MSSSAPHISRDLSTFVSRDSKGASTLELAVEGMRCAGCMSSVERSVMKVSGVITARVNLSSQRLNVTWQDAATSPDTIISAVQALGFKAYPFVAKQAETKEASEEKRLLRYLGVAAFAGMNIMLLSVSVWSGNASDITPETRDFFHWRRLIRASPFLKVPCAP
jgi:P-type Cu2+ transporter